MSFFRFIVLVILGCACGIGIYFWFGNGNGETDSIDPEGEGSVVDTYGSEGDRAAVEESPGNSEPTEADETEAEATDLSTPGSSSPERAVAGLDGREDREHSHVIRSRRGHWEPSLAEVGERFQSGEEQSFTLQFFDGASHVIEVARFTEHRLGGSVLRGEVAGFPGSLVSLASVNGSLAGSIHIPGEGLVYEIRPGPEGTTVFSEIDADALGECLTCLEPDTFAPPPRAFPQPVAPPIR